MIVRYEYELPAVTYSTNDEIKQIKRFLRFLQDVYSEYCCQGDPRLQGKSNCGSRSAYWQRLKNKSIKYHHSHTVSVFLHDDGIDSAPSLIQTSKNPKVVLTQACLHVFHPSHLLLNL